MSLKTSLKQIRELIDSGDNIGADKLIEEQLALGLTDYTLYLFAGVVKRNLGELSVALERYKAAIALDVDQLRAWQGAFALVTHSGWTAPPDEFVVEVVEKLILNAADQEKLALYKKWRIRFLLKLGSWERLSELEAELAERNELLLEAVRSLHPQIALLKSRGQAWNLAVRLLAHIEPSDPIDEASHRAATLIHCQVSPHPCANQWITAHMKAFPRSADVDILHHAVSFFSSELVLKALRTCVIPTPTSELAHSIACYSPTEGSDTTDTTDVQMASIIALINDKKLGEANSLLAGYALSIDQLRRWPVKGVALYLYWQLCQFHKIIQLLEADVTCSIGETPEITAVLRDAYWESRYRLVELPHEYRSLMEELHSALEVSDGSANSATLRKLLVLIESKRLSTMTEFNSIVSELGVESTSTVAYLRVYFVLNAMDDPGKALELLKAPALTNVEGTALPQERLDIALLSAKCAMGARRRDRALNELLAAVKMNAYFPDTFILLGENLLAMGTQLEKAKQCAERALLLKPSSERAARVLLSASEKLGASSEIRLNTLLQFLNEKPNSKWGLRQAANLEINLRQFPEASEHIQRLIRINPGDEESLDTNRINELCQLWTLLSEVYRQMGNFQSAVRATEAVLHHCPTSVSAKLQLLQLHQEMCRFEEAIVLGESLLGAISEIPTSLHGAIKLLHLHSLTLSVVDESTANRRAGEVLSRLEGIFKLAKNIEPLNADSCLYHKCIALALEALAKFNDHVLEGYLAQWGLHSPLPVRSRADVLRWRVNCLTTILKKNPRDPDNWASLTTCLLSAYRLGGDKSLVERSVECLRRAILLTHSKQKRSQLYCQLGKTYVVAGEPSRAQHCFIRALQLNKHSANAWCLLALLYLHLAKNEEALTAAHHAQKLDSFLMEAWCAQALHAELTHHQEAMDLFRHCIVLKPTPVAVKKYAHHLAQRIIGRRPVDSGSMIDFERVKDLYYTTHGRSDNLLHSLALLAEHFWYLTEAKQYIHHVDAEGILQRDKERIDIKCSIPSKALADPSLVRLRELYEQPVAALFERLLSHGRVGDLMSALKDADVLRFASAYYSTHFATLASAAIVFDMKFSPSVISVIGSVRPLHKLAEVYPPGLEKIVEEIRRFERQNVEERVLVRHDHLTETLFELLEQQREHRETKRNSGAETPTEDAEIVDGAG